MGENVKTLVRKISSVHDVGGIRDGIEFVSVHPSYCIEWPHKTRVNFVHTIGTQDIDLEGEILTVSTHTVTSSYPWGLEVRDAVSFPNGSIEKSAVDFVVSGEPMVFMFRTTHGITEIMTVSMAIKTRDLEKWLFILNNYSPLFGRPDHREPDPNTVF